LDSGFFFNQKTRFKDFLISKKKLKPEPEVINKIKELYNTDYRYQTVSNAVCELCFYNCGSLATSTNVLLPQSVFPWHQIFGN